MKKLPLTLALVSAAFASSVWAAEAVAEDPVKEAAPAPVIPNYVGGTYVADATASMDSALKAVVAGLKDATTADIKPFKDAVTPLGAALEKGPLTAEQVLNLQTAVKGLSADVMKTLSPELQAHIKAMDGATTRLANVLNMNAYLYAAQAWDAKRAELDALVTPELQKQIDEQLKDIQAGIVAAEKNLAEAKTDDAKKEAMDQLAELKVDLLETKYAMIAKETAKKPAPEKEPGAGTSNQGTTGQPGATGGSAATEGQGGSDGGSSATEGQGGSGQSGAPASGNGESASTDTNTANTPEDKKTEETGKPGDSSSETTSEDKKSEEPPKPNDDKGSDPSAPTTETPETNSRAVDPALAPIVPAELQAYVASLKALTEIIIPAQNVAQARAVYGTVAMRSNWEAPSTDGVYARLTGYQYKSKFDDLREAKDQAFGLEAGYVYALPLKGDLSIKVGASVLGEMGNSALSNLTTKTKNRDYGAKLFARMDLAQGSFAVLDVGYDRLGFKNTALGLDKHANMVSVGLAAGHELMLGSQYFVTPNVKFQYARVGGLSYTGLGRIEYTQESFTSLIGRLGVKGGLKLATGQVYASVDLNKEFKGDQRVRAFLDRSFLGDTNLSALESIKNKQWWVSFGLGGNVQLDKALALDAKATLDVGNRRKVGGLFQVGVSYKF